ncbi:DUF305 domain-containing protein [Pyrinomonas sp.]|uniref:CopM family metallochaperone n=1 Tax=Pyrinomonas sp. TaxID=2080306 RepID=UPI00332EA713
MRQGRGVIFITGVAVLTYGIWARGEQHRHSKSEAQRGEDFIVSTERSFPELMSEAMALMHKEMEAAPRTGDPDHDFVVAMIPHHQGAINMAKAVLLYGKDERVRRLAQQIIAEQQYEIELMRLWLERHERGAIRQEPQKRPDASSEEKSK